MLELDFGRYPVLVVDDEQDNLDAFRFAFRKSFNLRYAQGGAEALAMLDEVDPAVIVSDQRMPGMSGIEVLREAVRRRPDVVGVLLTAYTDLPVLLEAINSGAVHRYVQKPWDSKELAVILRQAIERFATVRDNKRLREQLSRYAGWLEGEKRDPIDFGELSGSSAAMRDAVARMEQRSPSNAPVLVTGEVGTEKELFARAVHVGSAREDRPFVTVSCASLSGAALDRELFGWERGAFDGAFADRPGRFELADGGTLVLLELTAASPALELRLGRLFAEKVVQRIGASGPVPADVRVIVTSSTSAERLFADPSLRAAFGEPLAVPALRDRKGDVGETAARLVQKYGSRHGALARRFSPEAAAALEAYEWPGNVRELEAVIERAVLVCGGDLIGPEHLAIGDTARPAATGATLVHGAAGKIDLPMQLDDIERRELVSALERSGGNKAEVARMLGIQRTTLYYRLKRLGIEV